MEGAGRWPGNPCVGWPARWHPARTGRNRCGSQHMGKNQSIAALVAEPATSVPRETREIAMKSTVAIFGSCLLFAARPASAGSDCADWNTGEFFKTATAEEVTGCLRSGSDPERTGRARLHPAALGGVQQSRRHRCPARSRSRYQARDGNGETALHHSVSHAHPDVTTALLKAGADPNARDAFGSTPMHLAARFNKTPAVTTMLLDAGADPAARNAEGETPRDFAARNQALENTGAYRRLHDAGF